MTAPAAPSPEAGDKPGFVDRLRARWPWFDHVWRAQERYSGSKGDFYAAGITYFTVFAMFPLLMVGFAAGGFLLASRPHLLTQIEDRIKATISGNFGDQLVSLMDAAISSRSTVGIIGLAVALWAGLGWMANLREALSQMWGTQRGERPGFVHTKLSDVVALLSAFVAIIITLVLTALGSQPVMEKLLGWLGLHDFPKLAGVLGVVSLLVSFLVAWLLFTWMIARLPRESVSFGSSVKAGLIAAVGFEVFKQVASIYLRSVLHGPAGATFGPVLGLMVFAYITARLVLFATAWAATSRENLREEIVPPPAPAVVNNRVITRPALQRDQAILAATAGALGALGLSRILRRRP
jgi:membrane protein